ncbi:RidA family protein [Persicitalea sp.]|uniref:RidA family protein n=1 Tax=Persicitalea sp. TaxID=3100273 RepID=UPI0035944290
MKREHLNPETLPDWSGMFNQVVVTEKHGLRLIHISGQVGVDRAKKVVGEGSCLAVQTLQSLENLRAALTSVGAEVSDVVKLTIYVVDYQYEQSAVIREALIRFFYQVQLPALSLIGVAALADPGFLIEIDAEVIAETN